MNNFDVRPDLFITVEDSNGGGKRVIRTTAVVGIRMTMSGDYVIDYGMGIARVATLPPELEWAAAKLAGKPIPFAVTGPGWEPETITARLTPHLYERGMGDLPVNSLVADATRPYVVHARLEDGWVEIPRAIEKGFLGMDVFKDAPKPIEQYEFVLAGGRILREGGLA